MYNSMWSTNKVVVVVYFVLEYHSNSLLVILALEDVSGQDKWQKAVFCRYPYPRKNFKDTFFDKCSLLVMPDLNSFLQGGVLITLWLCISGLDRSAFDNKAVSFDEHINSEHNMWHYLYFIVLLKVKDTTEFTGPESYVSLMVKVRHSWV